MEKFFTQRLLKWHRTRNDRQMPWKGERDPYRIWLSEIILQQTRVEQGRGYYLRFLEAYPRVQDLASAADREVFKLWEGLGYYARCRNLLHTARVVTDAHAGVFPDTYEGLLGLKGIGAYTAAAIASFAFGLPHAVVDGNVLRVLSRFFGVDLPVDRPEGRAQLTALAQRLLFSPDPAAYNQAIMDFGAMVCKPAQPACGDCILSTRCRARVEGRVGTLPVKSGKPRRRDRWFQYLLLEHRGRFLVRERQEGDIWAHLHEPLLLETDEPFHEGDSPATAFRDRLRGVGLSADVVFSPVSRQLLTHQSVHCRFAHARLGRAPSPPDGYAWVSRDRLAGLAFPRIVRGFLEGASVL